MSLDFRSFEPLVGIDRNATTRLVDSAYITPFTRRRAPTHLRSPSNFHTGAVYDQTGSLIPESQRWGGYGGDYFLATDDPRTSVAGGIIVGGDWLYLGHWMGQFGHWITETLPGLWGLPSGVSLAGIICHPFIFGNDIKEWQRQLLDDAGASGLDVMIVGDTPLHVERLHVPSRPVVLNAFAMPEAVAVWERTALASTITSSHDRVYLSVSAWREGHASGGLREYANQRAVDEAFADAGFHVVSPETLPVREQVSLARGADVLAGWSGSALHLSVFATSATRIIELGDRRSGAHPVPHQRVLTSARRQGHAYVPAMSVPGTSELYDVDRVRQMLNTLDA